MSSDGRSLTGPNFFVIGAQRAGTTRLCALLDRHPQVVIPTKEPMFFQSEKDMTAKADWYRNLFAQAGHAAARGEGSTYYSMCGIYPGTAQRLHEFNPQAKIIYLVRHPLRRIESAWVQLLSVGLANGFRGFERTLIETPLLVDPSLYWRQLSEYRNVFPDEQIHIELFDEFIAEESRVVAECLSFLELPPLSSIDIPHAHGRNASVGKRVRWPAVDSVRMIPGYERFKRFVPQSVKSLFTDRLTRPAPPNFEWSQVALEWATAQIAEDSARFLQHVGRRADYWSMR